MKIWWWRAAVLLAALVAWEGVARLLNPLLYVGPSRLPAALARVVATRDLPPLAGHVWLTLGEIAAAYLLAVAGGLWVGFVLGLRGTLGRFVFRFRYVEEELARRGLHPGEATLDEMNRIWDEAKGISKKTERSS